MTYKIEYSRDGVNWRAVREGANTSVASTPSSKRPVVRERLQDAYKEAEFHSHRYPYVRVVHPC